MSKRNLFVSFAESDGGHSYLAARAMLDPGSIAHLIFRNTVAESLEAVAAGQANYAIVPAYNSITQWEGATMKALASGGFEVCAQVCMPTSYVLVAHKDYISDFVTAYRSVMPKEQTETALTAEDEAKIYTRFLSRIFVGAQAEEQYRGRLIRPDMTNATIELSRNPLRILEQLTRSDLLKLMTQTPRHGGVYQQQPQQPIGVGNTPFLQPITATVMPGPAPVMEMMQAPAALVAAGLLDAPGDPEGWDQPGSLGEIVGLLRKLLVLLNVYSFGSPDLPENKTQYLLLGRRGAGSPPPDAIRSPAAAPTRIMTRVVPSFKKSSADQWLKPRAILSKRARDLGYVFDRPPVLLSPGNQRIFLFEGGKPKEGLSPNPLSMLEKGGSWLADLFEGPADAKDGKSAFRKSKEKTLRKALEKKLEGDPKDGTPGKFDTLFLGEYPTWCHGLSDDACWCCEEAHAEKDKGQETTAAPLLWLLAALALIAFLTYLFLRASCAIFGGSACALIGVPEPLPSFEPPPPTETAPPAAPLAPPAAPPKVEQPATPYPGLSQKPTVPPPAAVPPKIELPKPRIFHVAFFEAKANLTPEAMSALSSAAAQSVQMNKTVTLRVFALGGRETDDELWRRRLYAVKDELVRLGVPANRIRWEGAGPFNVVIRSKQQLRPQGKKRQTYDLDSVDDPLSPD